MTVGVVGRTACRTVRLRREHHLGVRLCQFLPRAAPACAAICPQDVASPRVLISACDSSSLRRSIVTRRFVTPCGARHCLLEVVRHSRARVKVRRPRQHLQRDAVARGRGACGSARGAPPFGFALRVVGLRSFPNHLSITTSYSRSKHEDHDRWTEDDGLSPRCGVLRDEARGRIGRAGRDGTSICEEPDGLRNRARIILDEHFPARWPITGRRERRAAVKRPVSALEDLRQGPAQRVATNTTEVVLSADTCVVRRDPGPRVRRSRSAQARRLPQAGQRSGVLPVRCSLRGKLNSRRRCILASRLTSMFRIRSPPIRAYGRALIRTSARLGRQRRGVGPRRPVARGRVQRRVPPTASIRAPRRHRASCRRLRHVASGSVGGTGCVIASMTIAWNHGVARQAAVVDAPAWALCPASARLFARCSRRPRSVSVAKGRRFSSVRL